MNAHVSKGLQVPAICFGALVFTSVKRRNGQVKRNLKAAFGVAIGAITRDQTNQR
ncbi:hypothetical protein ACFO6V_07295 [Promicromonospora alba]|uniref:Uncharacterized protein n=1 Tax=Promicromonospora alba TaxID=1616110 RepID=A0ABV9HCF5_9MICO